jgi:hypothetical protein
MIMRQSWKESLLIGVLFFVLYVAIGAYISQIKHYLPFDSLARLISAWLVFSGTEVKLASIGFLWPPIPTLVILPWVLIPPLVKSWLAVVVVSALFMALSCIILGQIAASCGISNWLRRMFMTIFGIHPFILMFGANGMSEAVLVAITLAACYWLIRFWQWDRNTHLIFAAGFFGLLPLIRYEYVILTIWAGFILTLLSWKRRSEFSEKGFRDFLEGRLLAYSSLAIYPLFLWALTSWYVMGNPIYFLLNDRSAVSVAEYLVASYARLLGSDVASFIVIFRTWFWIFPLGTIASIVGVSLGVRQRDSFLVSFSFMPWLIPLLQFILLIRQASVPLLRYFIMSVPLGAAISFVVYSQLFPLLQKYRWGKTTLIGAYLLLFVSSIYSSTVLLENYPFQTQERETWKALTSDQLPQNKEFEESYAIGKMLPTMIPSGSRVLIDTFHFGFAVMLGAGDHSIFMDFTDPNYDAALEYPPDYVDFVLVPKPEQRGALYSINMLHRSLHEEGAAWATLIEEFPETILEWKLYKVKR